MKEEIFQDKVTDIIQDNDNLEEIENAREEFKDFVSKPVYLVRPVPKQTRYIFSFDNLGLDQEMCETKRNQLFNLIKKIKHNAEKKELIALLHDVDFYLKYQREFSQDLVQTMEQDEEVEIEEKLNSIDDQKEDFKHSHFQEMYEEEFEDWDKQGKSNLVRLINLNNTFMRNKEVYLILVNQLKSLEPSFQSLIKMNFIKFHEIFQNLFYLLGRTKQSINIGETNVFNWRHSKGKLNKN